MTRAASLPLLPAAVSVLLAGCLNPDLAPLVPCTITGVHREIKITRVEKVDLLLLIDNSSSMAQEQDSLAREVPRLVEVLASGDVDADGTREFSPVKSLHVGVISSDMGTGGHPISGGHCDEPNFGDDGILRTAGRTDLGCAATYPDFFDYQPGSPQSPADLARDVTCVAQMGTGGCAYEQQLEAVLKSLTPSASPIRFYLDSAGHGDRENEGFLRDDSLLVVIALTDEEDCSASDPEIFAADSSYPGHPNIRCALNPAAVHPIERFRDGLLALRPSPDHLIFAAIAGIPVGVGNETGTNFDAMLAHADMQYRVDTSVMGTRLVPSCNVPGRGEAYPPRRIVGVAQQLAAAGATGTVFSICQESYRPALDEVITRIADVLKQTCLPRALVRDETGRVQCDVVQVLPATGSFTTCDSLADRGAETLVRMEDGRQVCRMRQLAVAAGAPEPGNGWYYDDFAGDIATSCPTTPQRIRFTDDAAPVTGSTVRLECLQPMAGTLDEGIPTEPVACGSDADCPAGHRCDVGAPSPVCVNPACSL